MRVRVREEGEGDGLRRVGRTMFILTMAAASTLACVSWGSRDSGLWPNPVVRYAQLIPLGAGVAAVAVEIAAVPARLAVVVLRTVRAALVAVVPAGEAARAVLVEALFLAAARVADLIRCAFLVLVALPTEGAAGGFLQQQAASERCSKREERREELPRCADGLHGLATHQKLQPSWGAG